MSRFRRKSQPRTVAVIIWSNIIRQQYLLGMTDEQLCDAMGVSRRSFYYYKNDPSMLNMKHLQSLVDYLGIDLQTLIVS